MWLTLALVTLLCLVTLYVPGYIFCRALSASRFSALAVAPAVSLLFLSIGGIAFDSLSLPTSGFILIVCSIVISAAALAASKAITKHRRANEPSFFPDESPAFAWKAVGLYVGISFAVLTAVFLSSIGSAESFARKDDTTFHLAVIRTFVETGAFSTLNVSSFLDQGQAGSFYPAIWHIICAVIMSMSNCDIMIASNAATVAFVAFVLPVNMCFFFLRVFQNHRDIILAGSLFVLAFCIFPWGFLTKGQLLPNMVSFSFIPLALALLSETINARKASVRLRAGGLLVIGIAIIGLSQPNGIFTFGIWAASYCLVRIFFPEQNRHAFVNRRRVAFAILFVALSCAAWVACYFAPFLQNVIHYELSVLLSVPEAIISDLSFMFTKWGGIQPFLSVMVLIGALHTLKRRQFLWMPIAFILASLIYIANVSLDGSIQHFFSGFWYNDYYRTGAMVSLFSIPLAALGFSCSVHALQNALTKIANKKVVKAQLRNLSICLLVIAMIVCQFTPIHITYQGKRDIQAGLPYMRQQIESLYAWDWGLTQEEYAFTQEVLKVIPEDALVINVPSDGSCWSYGTEGINVFFRRCGNASGGPMGNYSELIRTKLCDVGTSVEVREALSELDAHYLLILDDVRGENRTIITTRYKEENWQGIESINESTPGFETILSEGDMRLYKIIY